MGAKIFGIGLRKTGTRSLHEALRRLGFRASHAPVWQDRVATENLKAGRRLLTTIDDQFDAFTGLPMPFVFKTLDHDYPGSKFIWTHRSLESWLASMERQARINAADPFYGGDLKKIDPRWTALYVTHCDNVRDYFSGRGNFLDFSICNGAGWRELCAFLDFTAPLYDFPWFNKSAS